MQKGILSAALFLALAVGVAEPGLKLVDVEVRGLKLVLPLTMSSPSSGKMKTWQVYPVVKEDEVEETDFTRSRRDREEESAKAIATDFVDNWFSDSLELHYSNARVIYDLPNLSGYRRDGDLTLVGRGGFSFVYMLTYKNDNGEESHYAVKVMNQKHIRRLGWKVLKEQSWTWSEAEITDALKIEVWAEADYFRKMQEQLKPDGSQTNVVYFVGDCFVANANPRSWSTFYVQVFEALDAELHARMAEEGIVNMRFDEFDDKDKLAREGFVGPGLLKLQRLSKGKHQSALLKKYKQSGEELAKNIVRDVAQGLQAMHSAGLWHNDVKLSNIMEGYNKELNSTSWKLIDLGCGGQSDSNNQCRNTRDDKNKMAWSTEVAGTWQDGSPEQNVLWLRHLLKNEERRVRKQYGKAGEQHKKWQKMVSDVDDWFFHLTQVQNPNMGRELWEDEWHQKHDSWGLGIVALQLLTNRYNLVDREHTALITESESRGTEGGLWLRVINGEVSPEEAVGIIMHPDNYIVNNTSRALAKASLGSVNSKPHRVHESGPGSASVQRSRLYQLKQWFKGRGSTPRDALALKGHPSGVSASLQNQNEMPHWSRDPMFEGLSAEGRDFLSKWLTVDPVRRPFVRELLQHPWLQADAEDLRPRSSGSSSSRMSDSESAFATPTGGANVDKEYSLSGDSDSSLSC